MRLTTTPPMKRMIATTVAPSHTNPFASHVRALNTRRAPFPIAHAVASSQGNHAPGGAAHSSSPEVHTFTYALVTKIASSVNTSTPKALSISSRSDHLHAGNGSSGILLMENEYSR